jgi:hypothetical protein
MTSISSATVETFLRTDFKKFASHRYRIIASSKDAIDFFVEEVGTTALKSIDDLKDALSQTQKFRRKIAKAFYPSTALTELAYAVAILDANFRRVAFPLHIHHFIEKPDVVT